MKTATLREPIAGTGAQTNLFAPLFVDCFAGGGGWSTGAELALGRIIDIAINHDPDAILMHETNHPYTRHYCEDIYEVDPMSACGGRHVAWAHFSPDCKHFSRAKGAKPVDKKIRGLAWVVLRWAALVRPDIISLENVSEFKTWGPVRRGKPIKSRAGETFEKWRSQLESLGYRIEYRELVACDYGAPTTRKRFFLIARCDGKPIAWPEPTHGDPKSEAVKAGRLKPWRSAAEIIDWTLPAPSIFLNRKEIMTKYGIDSRRPLRPNTQRRIIRGIDKFTIKADNPFIIKIDKGTGQVKASSLLEVNHTGGDRGQSAQEPLHTVTMKHGYGVTTSTLSPVVVSNNENAAGSSPASPTGTTTTGGHQMLIVPSLTAIGQTGGESDRCRSVESQVHTTVSKAETCVVAPSLIQYHTEQTEDVRGQPVNEMIRTIDTANRYGYISACLAKYYGNDQHGQDIQDPTHTVTTKDRESLISAALARYHGESKEQSVNEPVPTTLSQNHDALLLPYMSKYFSGGYDGVGINIKDPVPTVTAVDHNALVLPSVVKMKGDNLGQSIMEPLQTVTASGLHFGAVMTTIVKVSPGADLQYWPKIRELLNTHCGYRLGDDEVLLLAIADAWFYIADIGLRMLSPKELYAANGFPHDYIIDRDHKGNEYGKVKQVARCGNAVPPPFATALVRANAPEYCGKPLSTMAELNERIAV